MSIVRAKRKKLIAESIADEHKAAKDYKTFPKKLGDKSKPNVALFNKLSDDEKSHERALRKIR